MLKEVTRQLESIQLATSRLAKRMTNKAQFDLSMLAIDITNLSLAQVHSFLDFKAIEANSFMPNLEKVSLQCLLNDAIKKIYY